MNAESAKTEPVTAARAGDALVGRPLQKPRELGPAVAAPAPAAVEGAVVRLEEIVSRPSLPVPRLFRSGGCALTVAAIMALLGLYVVSQSLAIIAQLAALPFAAQVACGVLLLFLLGVVLYAAFRFLWALHAYPFRPQLLGRQIAIRAGRLRGGESAYDVARAELQKYLREYARRDAADIKQLADWAGAEAAGRYRELPDIVRSLDRERHVSAHAWLEEYRRDFQQRLDELAEQRVRHYTLLIGAKTAISPFPWADIMIVLYNSFSLFRDLCLIYNRRYGSWQMAGILGGLLFNTYVAGQMHAAAQEGAGAVTDHISEAIARNVAKSMLAKVTEGTANALLADRLGKACMAFLRPIRD